MGVIKDAKPMRSSAHTGQRIAAGIAASGSLSAACVLGNDLI
jgi:hypothetical protein